MKALCYLLAREEDSGHQTAYQAREVFSEVIEILDDCNLLAFQLPSFGE
jgi:hypothetical protein